MPSANPYLYTNDDPVNSVDPSGRFSLDAFFTCIDGGIDAISRAALGSVALAGIGGAIATFIGLTTIAPILVEITAIAGAFLVGYCLGYGGAH